MKPHVLSLDGMPPPTTTRSKWWRFVDRYLPSVVIYLMLVTLVAVVLFPYAAVTVPSGHVGVLWKRFGGGTVLDPRQIRDEGLHLIWPWNELFLYDLRLQSVTETYNAISSDGVSLSATMNIRFRLRAGHSSGDRTELSAIADATRHRQSDAGGHGSIHRRAGLFDSAPGDTRQDPQPLAGQIE